MNVTKVWCTPFEYDTHKLSINTILDESKPRMKPSADVLIFPETPTEKYPKQQTISLGLFDIEDLIKIRDAIDEYLDRE